MKWPLLINLPFKITIIWRSSRLKFSEFEKIIPYSYWIKFAKIVNKVSCSCYRKNIVQLQSIFDNTTPHVCFKWSPPAIMMQPDLLECQSKVQTVRLILSMCQENVVCMHDISSSPATNFPQIFNNCINSRRRKQCL